MKKIILGSIIVLEFVFSLSAQPSVFVDELIKGFSGNFELVERVLDNELLALSDLGYVYRSKDFGKTWDVVNTPFDNAWFMSFQENKKRGYLTGGYNLAITNDGGYTWDNIPLTGIPQNLKIQKAFPKNEDTLFLSVSGKENGMKIYMKSRFSEQWEKVADELYNTLILNLSTIYFPTPSHGYALGRGYYAETLDGGKTWKKNLLDANTIFRGSILLNDGTLMQTYSNGTPPQLEGIKWHNSEMYGLDRLNNIIVGTSDSEMYYSTDEGESWTIIPFDFSTFIYDISIYNDETFVVVGNYLTSYITTDRGEAWTKYVHGGGEGFNSIYCKNSEECFITGKKGRVFATNDGGRTWNMQDVSNDALYEIEFPTNEIGYIVGHQVLIKTIDGGLTWNKYNTKIAMSEYIDFINENIGYMGYSNSMPTISKTTNGGEKWKYVFDDTYDEYKVFGDYYPFSFRNENDGAVCASNVLLYTSDGGNTWRVAYETPEQTYLKNVLSISDKGWLLYAENTNSKEDLYFFCDNEFNCSLIFSGEHSSFSGELQKINDTTYRFTYDTLDYITTDEGLTWNPVFTGLKGSKYLVDAHHGYSIYGGQIYKATFGIEELQVSVTKCADRSYELLPQFNGETISVAIYLKDIEGILTTIADNVEITNEIPITIDIPENISGKYSIYIESQNNLYKSVETEMIEITKKTPINVIKENANYRIVGQTIYAFSKDIRLYTITGEEISILNGVITLKSGIYILVNGNETYKIVIK